MASGVADRPVVPRKRGNARGGKGPSRAVCSTRATRLHQEAETTVSTKLAELGQRARREARLTNVIQFVDEELLRLAFRSLRKQAAPGVDGQRYEDYAKDLPANLRDL